jgi:hypothetical protein
VTTTVVGFEEGAKVDGEVWTTADGFEEEAEVDGEAATFNRVVGGTWPQLFLRGMSGGSLSSTEPPSEVEHLCKNENLLRKIMIKQEALSRPNKMPWTLIKELFWGSHVLLKCTPGAIITPTTKSTDRLYSFVQYAVLTL